MRFAQILNNKAHWIFEEETKPDFSPEIFIIDITGKNDIQEGWYYKDGVFTKENPYPPTIEEVVAKQQLDILDQSELQVDMDFRLTMLEFNQI